MTENQIELPHEVVSEFYESDIVRVIVAPPADVPSPEWVRWAHEAFPLPVVSVERVPEGGRLLLAVTLAEEPPDEEATPKTFRLTSPASYREKPLTATVTINLNGAEWTPPPPAPAQPTAPRDTCSRPVRVRGDTHRKIRALSKRLGLGIADTIDRAVCLLEDETGA